jgi:LAS superfamily LD-carboxypeptidase LdcB
VTKQYPTRASVHRTTTVTTADNHQAAAQATVVMPVWAAADVHAATAATPCVTAPARQAATTTLPTRAQMRAEATTGNRTTRRRNAVKLPTVKANRNHVAGAGLAFVASATFAVTTMMGATVDTAGTSDIDAESAATIDITSRDSAASRSGVRVDGTVENPEGAVASASAVSQAASTLARADQVTTETVGVSDEQRTSIIDSAAVVRELQRRAAEADSADETPDAADMTRSTSTASADNVDPAVSQAADTAIAAATDDLAGAYDTATDEDGNTIDHAADTVDPASALALALSQTTDSLATLLDETAPTTVLAEGAPLTPAEIAEQEAAKAKEEAGQNAALAAEAAKYGNGQIPASLLRNISFASSHQLRADAAASLERMNAAYRAKFGENMVISDSYRSYGEQVATKRVKGFWAATPGTSNHGFGLAVDFGGGIQNSRSAQQAWMDANAAKFGWTNPDWAQGSKFEPWHWEYTAGM